MLAAFGYDDLGRRTSLTRGNGTSTSYSYDPASRLSQLADNPAGTTHDQTLSFAYNPASQIVSNTRSNDLFAWTGHGSGTTSSTANGLNQLASLGAATPGYDSKGNMTSDTARSYSYASDNQMVSGGGLAMIHDPLGRLIWVQNQGWVTDYAGAEVADELAVTTYAIQRRFVYGPGVDEPLVWYEGSGTSDRRFLHADERGSIVAVSDSSGAVTNVNTYDEYGKPGSGNAGRFQYTGQKWIAELGLYDYKARMYHPGLGRFMQPDPIGYGGGMNLYAYVGNDPLNKVDPTGQSCSPVFTGTFRFYYRLHLKTGKEDPLGSEPLYELSCTPDSQGPATATGGKPNGKPTQPKPRPCSPTQKQARSSGRVIFTANETSAHGIVGFTIVRGHFGTASGITGSFTTLAFGFGAGLSNANVVGFSRNLSTFVGGNDTISVRGFGLINVQRASDLDGNTVGGSGTITSLSGPLEKFVGQLLLLGADFNVSFSNTEISNVTCPG